jgi:formylglycine-generating enzyme required for sulfatase activity
MSNRQAYEKFLKAKTDRDIAPILDPTETNSMNAVFLAMLSADADAPKDVRSFKDVKSFLFETLEHQHTSTNDLLDVLNQAIVKKYALPESVFVGVYPTTSFDGQTIFGDDGPLILVNEGALQLIGGVVQLLFSRHGRQRQVQELKRMATSYVTELTVPDNSAFTGSWADFDLQRYREMANLGTAAETFLVLHEYGHVLLRITESIAEEELRADNWALQKIKDAPNSPDLFFIGPFIFLGLCYLVEILSRDVEGAVPQTHPGAPLRIAQAAAELIPSMSAGTKKVSAQFLTLVDYALSESASSPRARVGKIFEVVDGLSSLPIGLLDIVKDVDRSIALRSVLEVAMDDASEAKSEGDLGSLPPGLRPAEEPNIFLYELPSGEAIEMVFVGRGEFLRGPRLLPGYPSEDDLDGAVEAASRSSTTQDFYIGRYPILWCQYEAFCRARDRELPAPPPWDALPTRPVVNVTVADAEAFCVWAGLQFPSEAEWEKAARGTDGRLFPWGGSSPGSSPVSNRTGRDAPPSAFPDLTSASPYGAEQMVGGVWEITGDWLESDVAMNAGRYRVLRGAPYKANPLAATVLSRHRVMPNFPRDEIGFRVILRVQAIASSDSHDWIADVLGKSESDSPPTGTPIAALTASEQDAARLLFQACDEPLTIESVDVVQRVLVAHPECVTWINDKGYTPLLQITAKLPYFEIPYRIASLLINAGADPSARTPDGSTALHMLACRPQMFALEIADMLLEHGADPTIADKRGQTAEMVARRWAALGMGDGFLALLSVERRARDATSKLPVPSEVAEWLSMLDSTHVVTGLFDDDGDREDDAELADYMEQINLLQNRIALLRRIIDQYRESAVEYLIVNLRLASVDSSEYESILAELLGHSNVEFTSDEEAIQERWRNWWCDHRRDTKYSALSWRLHSPRLARAADALFVETMDQIPVEADGLVRLALARNPSVSREVTIALTRAPEPYIRICLAASPRTPAAVLSILALDPNSYVRRWVASNPNADDKTLDQLSNDESTKVRNFLKQNPRRQ